MTPRQIAREFKSASKRIEQQHNDRAWLAWHIAVLPRQKKIPKLETMLAGHKKTRRKQSWEEQQAVMAQWEVTMRRVGAK